jgi:hypothetical protein
LRQEVGDHLLSFHRLLLRSHRLASGQLLQLLLVGGGLVDDYAGK